MTRPIEAQAGLTTLNTPQRLTLVEVQQVSAQISLAGVAGGQQAERAALLGLEAQQVAPRTAAIDALTWS